VSAVRKGEPWGRPSTGPAEVTVAGADAALAQAVAAHPPSTRFAWMPTADADFARSVGVTSADGGRAGAGFDLPCDLLEIAVDDGPPVPTVNMAVVGAGPDVVRRRTRSAVLRVEVNDRVVHDGPATGLVIANGEYLRGADVVPRGHPGDGRVEVQVYAVAPGERSALRDRVRTGTHVPHPAVTQAVGATVVVSAVDGARLALEIDGTPRGSAIRLRATVVPQRFVLVT